jgi:putative oxidoreductase
MALRVVIGVTFVVHGWQKLAMMGLPATAAFFDGLGVPAPLLSAAMVTAVELVGGVALILGFLSRWVAVPLALDMLAALLLFHLPRGFFASAGGVELALLLLVALVTLALTGSGALALDRFVENPSRTSVVPARVLRTALAGHD